MALVGSLNVTGPITRNTTTYEKLAAFPTTDNAPVWYRLGRFTGGAATMFIMDIYGGVGYNAGTEQAYYGQLVLRTGNSNVSGKPNIAGRLATINGGSSTYGNGTLPPGTPGSFILNLKVKSVNGVLNDTSHDIYAQIHNYSYNSCYKVSVSGDGTWTHYMDSAGTDPGSDSTTVYRIDTEPVLVKSSNAAFAWCRFVTSPGVTITSSYNTSSITDNGWFWDLNFSNAAKINNYVGFASFESGAENPGAEVGAYGTGGFRCWSSVNGAETGDKSYSSLAMAAFGGFGLGIY